MTLFNTLCSGHFSVFCLHDLTKAIDNVDHFFLPKTLSFPYSMTLLSLYCPLTYLAVPSNPLISLFSHSQGFVVCLFLMLHTLSVQFNSCLLLILPHVGFHCHSKINIFSQGLFLEFLIGLSICPKIWYIHLSVPPPPHQFVLKLFC